MLIGSKSGAARSALIGIRTHSCGASAACSLGEQFSRAVPAQLARRCLRQRSGGKQPYLARGVPNSAVYPRCDVAADTQAHVLLVGVENFREHREALSLGIDTQRDHATLAHTVDVLGRTLDIVRIQVHPRHDDEILRAATDVEPPLLVEVTQIAAVEPAVMAGEWKLAVHREITASDRRTTKLDSANLTRPLHRPLADDPHVHAFGREAYADNLFGDFGVRLHR